MQKTTIALSLPAIAVLLLVTGTVGAQQAAGASGNVQTDAAYSEHGRYFTADGVPTFNVAADGMIDWPTYSGFRRYHSECHVCHGPEGEGSSYAPALKDSAINMEYYEFVEVVVNGREVVNAAQHNVMPSFGTNVNVMCYLDDIYTYLKARGAGAVPRGRPGAKEAKSDEIAAAEKSCFDM
ncbi:c-type cytochrome, methanol metabolism-related [Paracoccaceae bacterium Fryx2]|nr:c-type cytochrome, methanol metabolism-related [Paracoccaceae bacterium Fryx2]